MAKDYYHILGVDKKASKDDVKKAFRKLAHKYHPDKKGGNKERFNEVSEAYAVLSDEKKRAEYDAYGRTFSGGGGQGFGGFDFSQFTQGGNVEFDLGDIFSEFFGGGRGGRRNTQRGRDIAVDVEVTFEESVFGVERKMLITKDTQCDRCEGKGGEPGTNTKTCDTCNGKGAIHETKQTLLGAVTTNRVCESCNGQGTIPEKKCSKCRGEGISREQEEIQVKIPSGINNGEMIRLTGKGEAVRGGVPGDFYIKVHVKPHETFRKDGANLYMDLKVKLTDAILGATYGIKTLDGAMDLKIPAGVKFNDVLRIKGKGVPVGGRRGDILVRINIDVPQKLSSKAKKLLDELKEEGI